MNRWDLITELLAAATELPIEERRAWLALGHGGMGYVYEAIHIDPSLSRRVAIKVIGAKRFHPGLIERFLQERSILARLEHPGIARLYDTGTTPNGLPYFAMEFVDGKTLDAWIASNQPSLRERVQLFAKICDAIAYAHRNLIVHGDLKPGNILVTDAGEPRLLDFGIAKVLSDGEVEGAPMLTPRHASPEQLAGLPITTASDVFQAGLLLRGILSQSNSELDAIIHKCLRQAPQERYSTADALKEDLTNWLNHKPITAVESTPIYRMQKRIQRHPLGAAFVIALALGAVTTAWQAWRAEQARAQATHQFEEIRKFSRSMLRGISDLPIASRKPIVEKTASLLNGFAQNEEKDPVVLLEVAQAWRSLAAVQGLPTTANFGDRDASSVSYARAIQLAERARALNEKSALILLVSLYAEAARVQVSGKNTDAATQLIQKLEAATAALDRFGPSAFLANAYSEIAFFRSRKDRKAGIEAYRKAIAEFDRSPDADPTQKAYALKRWGALLLVENRLDEGAARYLDALKTERASKANPLDMSFTLSDLGFASGKQGRLAEALKYHNEALEIREAAHKKDPSDVRVMNSLANTWNNIAWVHSETGVIDKAIEAERRSIAIWELSSRPPHDNPFTKQKLAWGRLFLVYFLLRAEATAELSELRQLLSAVRQTQEQHPDPAMARELIPYAGIL
ncbi:MAG: serine/threonine-protein kinase [Acidobacteria bacterium]|nr:serine/threonine-protein kinase [Acidobacteriota bacterium]